MVDTNILILFIGLSIVNVVFSTIKSIVTIKGNAVVASLVSALYYGYYNIVLIYTVADFPIEQKVAVTFLCNLVGVFVVKFAEEKSRKDKLWKVEATVDPLRKDILVSMLKARAIPFNYVDVDKYVIFNIYCAAQYESRIAKECLTICDAKYFVSESKEL